MVKVVVWLGVGVCVWMYVSGCLHVWAHLHVVVCMCVCGLVLGLIACELVCARNPAYADTAAVPRMALG